MQTTQGKTLLGLTIFISFAAGTFILLQDWTLTGQFGYSIAILLAIMAVIYASSPRHSWLAVATMLGGALYVFYRSTGRINFPALRYVLGFGMYAYAIYALIKLLGAGKKTQSSDD